MTHGRENMVIMDSTNTTFGKQNLVTVSRSLAIFLLFLFIGCLVATGLLVYNLSSCPTITTVDGLEKVACTKDTKVENTSESFYGSSSEVYESTTTSTTTEKPKTDIDLDIRLPRSVTPTYYTLRLIPFLQEGNFTFHGNVSILVNVTETCRNITLHAVDLIIYNVHVYDELNNSVPVRDIRNDSKREFLVVNLDQLIEQGQYSIHIVFEGVLNDLMQGFYRSSYTENGETRWLAVTQFQPTDARRAFPCFDEPALKAKFQITLARLKNMTSISNMRKVGKSENLPDLPDYVWDVYEETLPMSTYLLAFVICDFEKISNGTFSVWARKSALSQAKYSLEIGPKILQYYEEFFGIKYPLPKLDLVAVPDFPAGAMENWGLITFRELVLLYEEGVSSASSLQRIAHVVAHELAHQWFGNLVTPSWWTDLWLNEGFATFVEYLGVDAVGPKWREPDLFLISEIHGSFVLDALKSSHPISVVVNNPDEVNDIFDSISYSKGATIIRMMQNFLSERVFHRGLNNYLNQRKYSHAEQDDLWETLTEQSHKDGVLDESITIKSIMDTWTLQTGYPVVTVTRDYKNSLVELSQERFILDKENKSDEDVLWWIPVTYASETGIGNLVWIPRVRELTVENITIADNSWMLVNVNQTGYYRVNYDITNWKLIMQQMQKKDGHLVFDPKNRAQLLNDALNLAVSGYLDYNVALDVTKYLIQEKDYVPWNAALDQLTYLRDMFIRTGHFDKYKVYVLKLIEPRYKEIAFKELKSDDHLTIFNRNQIMDTACTLGMRDCIIQAVQQFQNWKNSANPDKYNYINPDLRSVIYCTAISDGGQEEWDFAWQRYANTNVANEQEILLTALGCSKEIWILSRYLEWSLSEHSGIRKQDVSHVFNAVAINPIGQQLAYRFFKDSWERLRIYLGPSSSSLSNIVRSVTSNFNSELEVADFKAFFKLKYDEFGVAQRTANQTIEQAEANIKWMKKYSTTIVRWLSTSKLD